MQNYGAKCASDLGGVFGVDSTARGQWRWSPGLNLRQSSQAGESDLTNSFSICKYASIVVIHGVWTDSHLQLACRLDSARAASALSSLTVQLFLPQASALVGICTKYSRARYLPHAVCGYAARAIAMWGPTAWLAYVPCLSRRELDGRQAPR